MQGGMRSKEASLFVGLGEYQGAVCLLGANAGTRAPFNRQCRGSACKTPSSHLAGRRQCTYQTDRFCQTEATWIHLLTYQYLLVCTSLSDNMSARQLTTSVAAPSPKLARLPQLTFCVSPHVARALESGTMTRGPFQGRNLDPCTLGPGTFSGGIALNLPSRGRTHRRRAGPAPWAGRGAATPQRPRFRGLPCGWVLLLFASRVMVMGNVREETGRE